MDTANTDSQRSILVLYSHVISYHTVLIRVQIRPTNTFPARRRTRTQG